MWCFLRPHGVKNAASVSVRLIQPAGSLVTCIVLVRTPTLSKQGCLRFRSPWRMSFYGDRMPDGVRSRIGEMTGALSCLHTARTALTDPGSCKSRRTQSAGRHSPCYPLLAPTLPGWSGPTGGEFLPFLPINRLRPSSRLTGPRVILMTSWRNERQRRRGV